MRKWVLLTVLAASFALYGNGAFACANSGHAASTQETVTTTAHAEFYFEQAAAADHRAHHDHRKHGERGCDGTCCCHAASAGAALIASVEIDHPAVQSLTLRRYLPDFHPPQLITDFYGPPRSFA